MITFYNATINSQPLTTRISLIQASFGEQILRFTSTVGVWTKVLFVFSDLFEEELYFSLSAPEIHRRSRESVSIGMESKGDQRKYHWKHRGPNTLVNNNRYFSNLRYFYFEKSVTRTNSFSSVRESPPLSEKAYVQRSFYQKRIIPDSIRFSSESILHFFT